MKKFFLKALIFLSVFIALDVALILALPHIVSLDKISAEAKAQVRQATGRDLNFKDAAFVFWPNLGVTLKQVTLGNAPWAKEKTMLTLDKADVALAILPLLDKQVVIKKFILDAPVINLETGADGRQNWDFSGSTSTVSAPSDKAAAGGGLPGGYALQFGKIEIKYGRISFADRQKGGGYEANDVNISIRMPDLKSALDVEGSLGYRQKRLDVMLHLDRPMDFLNGKPSPGRLFLKTEDVAAKADGNFATAGALMKGALEMDVTSLSRLLAWTSGKKQKPPFEKISFNSTAHVSAATAQLTNAVLKLDDLEAKGAVNVGLTGKPEIFARVAIGKINLDRFTGEETAAESGPPAAATGGDWDTTPIDFSALRAANADLELKTEGFSLRGADVGPSTLTMKLQDGVLRFTSSEALLFGGKFDSSLTVNAAAEPTLAFNFNMAGVQAQPVLSTFAHFSKLSGTAEAKVSLSSTGNDQREIISRLSGNGVVTFRDGSLEGIDLVNIAKMVQSRLTDMGVGQGKTDFVEMGGTFTIDRGIMVNNDLKMKGPLLQATGQGSVDLPRKFIQYRATPVLTASSAVEGAQGIAVPVDIKGPFSNIKIKPDYASVIQNAIDNPQAAKDTAKVIRDEGRVIRQNIKDIKKDLKNDPAKAIQSILGGGIFAPPPKEEPAPEAATPEAPQPQPQPLP